MTMTGAASSAASVYCSPKVNGEPTQSYRLERGLAVILAAGVVLVMLAALSFKVFELDRYFVPKELVLNVAALLVGIFLIAGRRPVRADPIDALLVVFLLWSVASGVLATNHWLAQRALAVSLSSAIVFWGARRAAVAGVQRALLGAAAIATVIAASTSLAQAYGLDSDWFTLARSPGGTLGNRNFIAHIVAIGLPVTLWSTIVARRSIAALAGSLAIAILSATLVLSRSRAAWLAVAAFIAVTSIPFFVSRKYWKNTHVGGRFARALLAAFLGGAVAVIIPNTLQWKSDSPYMESARKVVDYSSGSGRGRIAQYQNSLKIVKADPVFGAGPGNWPVRYPRFAPEGDKSLTESGMTANPWPSSDWVAFVSERGFVATIALLAVFAILFFGSLRKWQELGSHDLVLLRLALAGTVVTTMVVSAFDAVLLLPAPAFIVWLILGAAANQRNAARDVSLSESRARVLTIVIVMMLIVGVLRSATQVAAMSAVGTGGQTAGWVLAARLDPGSYRINQRLADIYANRGRCSKARPYARRALQLFPTSPQAKRTARRCGVASYRKSW
jgi:O-antigen ligase